MSDPGKKVKRAAVRPAVGPPLEEAEAARHPKIARLQEELRLANERFAGVVEISADAVVAVDDAERIVLFNQGATAIFGYRSIEVIGQPLSILLPDAARARHTEHLRSFAASGVRARLMGGRQLIRGRRKSGDLFPAEASISVVELGAGRMFTAVLRDVTERAQLLASEKAARQSAEDAGKRWSFLAEAGELLDRSLDTETTLASLASLVVPSLADCCLIDVLGPDREVRRLGAAHADPARAGIMDAMRQLPIDLKRPFISRHTLETGEMERVAIVDSAWIAAHTQDEEHRRLVRALRPASYIVLPLRVREFVFGSIAFLRCDEVRPYTDAEVSLASELAHRAAQALENARLYGGAQRAIRARDDVLGIVSHDLRNPLSAIAMCTTTLLEEPDTAPDVRVALLDMVRQSVDWMNRIIQDLLDIASIEAGRLSVHRAHATVDEVLAVARPSLDALTKEHTLTVVTVADLPEIDVDPDRIAQLLANLVGNAAKFTPAGGLIALTVDREGPDVRFTVRDAGSGIPADDLPHIFDRFWHARRTARIRGTGLGLAIAKGIIEAHGGTIVAESALGAGATFVVRIPAVVRGATA